MTMLIINIVISYVKFAGKVSSVKEIGYESNENDIKSSPYINSETYAADEYPSVLYSTPNIYNKMLTSRLFCFPLYIYFDLIKKKRTIILLLICVFKVCNAIVGFIMF